MNHRLPLPGLVTAAALVLLPLLACCQQAPDPGTDTPVAASCDWTAGGEGTSNRFGFAVGTAGDVDGDGYSDVVIGGDQYKEFTGRAYVYAGGPTGLSASPVFVATGEDVNNHFGYAVGTAGDVNGDGYDDLIAGAYHHANFRGRAYVYTGGSDGLAEPPSFVLTGEGPEDYFGRAVATAGDVDGDGYDDVIVGAQAYDESTGRAYVYAGGPAGLRASPVFVVSGEGPSSSFGQSVGTAGDVDGDGYDDVIVGAHGYDHGTGRIYVYAGDGGGLQARPLFVATGAVRGDRYGFAVGTAGDVNGDGYSDVIVGAYGAGEETGQVYVYAGGPGGLGARPAFTATGEAVGDEFGRAVGTAGDVNGDGYDDVIVGARSHDGNTGRVYLYAGSAGGLDPAPLLVFDGQEPNSWYGHAVGTAGDVDGDGYVEVIVGAYGYGDWTGQAYVPCTAGDDCATEPGERAVLLGRGTVQGRRSRHRGRTGPLIPGASPIGSAWHVAAHPSRSAPAIDVPQMQPIEHNRGRMSATQSARRARTLDAWGRHLLPDPPNPLSFARVAAPAAVLWPSCLGGSRRGAGDRFRQGNKPAADPIPLRTIWAY